MSGEITSKQQWIEKKEEVCKRRDALADLYTEYIQKLVEFENSPEQYDEYVKKMEDLEPKTRETKEEMREINRKMYELGFLE